MPRKVPDAATVYPFRRASGKTDPQAGQAERRTGREGMEVAGDGRREGHQRSLPRIKPQVAVRKQNGLDVTPRKLAIRIQCGHDLLVQPHQQPRLPANMRGQSRQQLTHM